MTFIVGGVLALANQLLKDEQQKSIELDTKTSILKAVTEVNENTNVLELYESRIQSLVVDFSGNIIEKNSKGEPVIAEKVEVAKEYKKNYKERLYPVFKFINDSDPSKVDAYIVPVYGAGLWDKIWGFVALGEDLETIVGVAFSHKQETPGLGARISDSDIQDRYKGKSIYNENGRFVSVMMEKGEIGGGGQGSVDAFNGEPNKVDGMSGATLTGKGVNEMLKSYLGNYQKYFDSVKK